MKNAFAALLLSALPLAPVAQDRALAKTVTVKAPLDAVWSAWTTTEGITTFFAPAARVEARPGGPFEIYFNPFAKPGLKGADDMVVMAVQEKKMLSFTWNAPPHLGEVRGQRTAVTVRFSPAGDALTEVRLTHTGWGDGGQWDQSFDYFDKAWGRVLANLQKRFAEGPIDWTPFLKQLKDSQEAADSSAEGAKKP